MRGCFLGHAFGWGGWQIELVCMVLVVGLVLYVAHRLMHRKKYDSDRRDSLEILKQRLASGEISLEEYEKIRKVL